MGTSRVDGDERRAHREDVGISVLGPLTVDDSAARMGPRETLVLAALAMRPGEVVARSGWPTRSGAHASGVWRRSSRAASCGSAALGARPSRRAERLPPGRAATRSTPSASSGRSPRASCRCSGARAGGLRPRRGLALWRGASLRARRLGAGADRGRPARGAAARRRGAAGGRGPARRAGTGR